MSGAMLVGALPGTLLYGAVADLIWVGIAANSQTGDFYPSIEILFPEETTPGVLAVAKEMEQLHEAPEVYFNTEEGTTNVGIFFIHRRASADLLKTLAGGHIPPAILSLVQGETRVIVVAETDYAIAEIRAFLNLFMQTKTFKLFLIRMENNKRTPAWGMELPIIREGRPNLL